MLSLSVHSHAARAALYKAFNNDDIVIDKSIEFWHVSECVDAIVGC